MGLEPQSDLLAHPELADQELDRLRVTWMHSSTLGSKIREAGNLSFPGEDKTISLSSSGSQEISPIRAPGAAAPQDPPIVAALPPAPPIFQFGVLHHGPWGPGPWYSPNTEPETGTGDAPADGEVSMDFGDGTNGTINISSDSPVESSVEILDHSSVEVIDHLVNVSDGDQNGAAVIPGPEEPAADIANEN